MALPVVPHVTNVVNVPLQIAPARCVCKFCGPSGGSVKATGLGDGATPKDPFATYEADMSAIAKLPLDAATRMPGYLHSHSRPRVALR